MTPMVIMLQDAVSEGAKGGLLGMGSSASMIVMMVLIFVVMWLFMIRPQQKQQKELNKFRQSLEKGQKVITAGGIHGSIKDVKDASVVITVDKDVTIEVDKSMIMRAPGDAPQK